MGAKFEDLEVWKNAKEFAVTLYKSTDEGNLRKDFGLKDQLRRAGISIVSNIAEGFERNGNKELIQFLSYAKGSAGEIRAQLHIARDLGYLSAEQFEGLMDKVLTISKMLAGFINYIKNSEFKGSKFVSEPIEDYKPEDFEF
jgi:four helix bundle protein